MLLQSRRMRYTAGNICLVVLTALIFSTFTGFFGGVNVAAAAQPNDVKFVDSSNQTADSVTVTRSSTGQFSIKLTPVTNANILSVTIPGLTYESETNLGSVSGIVYSVYEYLFSGATNSSNAPLQVYVYRQVYGESIPEYVYLSLLLQPPESTGGGGGSNYTPEEETPEEETPEEETSKVIISDDIVNTPDDSVISEGLATTGNAVITLEDSPEATAEISTEIVETLATVEKPLVVENQGVELEFAAQSLNTEEIAEVKNMPETFEIATETGELLKAEDIQDVTVELGAQEVSLEEQQNIIEKAKVGESTGLFEVGGKVVDLTAQVKYTSKEGKTATKKIEGFAEPVKVAIDLSDVALTAEQIAKLTGIRYEVDANGNVQPVKLGGTYDPVNKVFTFYTGKFSLYGVLEASKINKINLAIGSLNPTVNGINLAIDVPPTIINDRTMVPLRFIAESFGAEVDWDGETRTVKIVQDGKELNLVIGQTGPDLDVPATIIAGRTLVPLRYVSESLDAGVLWFPSTRSVEIVQ